MAIPLRVASPVSTRGSAFSASMRTRALLFIPISGPKGRRMRSADNAACARARRRKGWRRRVGGWFSRVEWIQPS